MPTRRNGIRPKSIRRLTSGRDMEGPFYEQWRLPEYATSNRAFDYFVIAKKQARPQTIDLIGVPGSMIMSTMFTP
jgi:hypothetical protein